MLNLSQNNSEIWSIVMNVAMNDDDNSPAFQAVKGVYKEPILMQDL